MLVPADSIYFSMVFSKAALGTGGTRATTRAREGGCQVESKGVRCANRFSWDFGAQGYDNGKACRVEKRVLQKILNTPESPPPIALRPAQKPGRAHLKEHSLPLEGS